MKIWLYTLASVAGVSLLSFAGALLLGLNRKKLRWLSTYLVSLAIGALLGGAFLHLIPVSLETFDHDVTLWLLVMGGFLGSFLLEKMIGAHSHHHSVEDWQGIERRSEERPKGLHAMVGVILVGDGVHNFLDGIVIAGAFLMNPQLGLITTIIVVLHEVPQEFGDFGVLVSGGMSVGGALKWNFITALTSVAGAVLALLIGARVETFSNIVIPLAAGNFIYIAGADLVPHLHQKGTKGSTAGMIAVIIVGILLMLWIHELRHQMLPE